jgi:metallophosphoesterase superfamily enzyme
MQLAVHDTQLCLGGFCFVHDLLPEDLSDDLYYISGHLHPGVRIGGQGKPSLRFPCFYFTPRYAVLPAFSRFSGMALIEPKKGENVFAIVEDQLILVNG